MLEHHIHFAKDLEHKPDQHGHWHQLPKYVVALFPLLSRSDQCDLATCMWPVFRIVVPRKPYPFAPKHIKRDQPEEVGPKTNHRDFEETEVPTPIEENPCGEYTSEASPMDR